MTSRQRTFSIAVSLIGLALLLLLQILSWRQHRRLNAGAFLLLIPILSPFYTRNRNGKNRK